MKAKVYPETTWESIKQEYISSLDSSYKALATLHGVPYTQVRNRALEERWPELKAAYQEQLVKDAIQSSKDFQKNENDRTFRIASKLLDKIEQSVEELIPADRDGIKKLTSAIMDLKNIGIFRADLDREEQLARINKLRKDAEDDMIDKTITIKFEEGFDEYGT